MGYILVPLSSESLTLSYPNSTPYKTYLSSSDIVAEVKVGRTCSKKRVRKDSEKRWIDQVKLDMNGSVTGPGRC